MSHDSSRCAKCIRLRHCATSRKVADSGSLDLLEAYGPEQAWTGFALPFLYRKPNLNIINVIQIWSLFSIGLCEPVGL